MSLSFNSLRFANRARDKEWVDSTACEGASLPDIPLSFSALELAGETGELCNKIKKLERTRLGLVGGMECNDLSAIADEMGDVAICLDLLAMRLNLNLSDVIRRKFNKTSDKYGFITRL